jgi:hypothetical protein
MTFPLTTHFEEDGVILRGEGLYPGSSGKRKQEWQRQKRDRGAPRGESDGHHPAVESDCPENECRVFPLRRPEPVFPQPGLHLLRPVVPRGPPQSEAQGARKTGLGDTAVRTWVIYPEANILMTVPQQEKGRTPMKPT